MEFVTNRFEDFYLTLMLYLVVSLLFLRNNASLRPRRDHVTSRAQISNHRLSPAPWCANRNEKRIHCLEVERSIVLSVTTAFFFSEGRRRGGGISRYSKRGYRHAISTTRANHLHEELSGPNGQRVIVRNHDLKQGK